MPRSYRRRRPWDVRIDRTLERIVPLSVLMDGQTSQRYPWVEYPRALFTMRIDRSFIYESRLRELGHTCDKFPTRKIPTHLGQLNAVSVVPLIVAKRPSQHGNPFCVDFNVLPGGPPEGGVDMIIGSLDITSAFGGTWSPDWTSEQYVMYSAGGGWNTAAEAQAIINLNGGSMYGGAASGGVYPS